MAVKKTSQQDRRADRYSVDLSAPMIFCVVETLLLLALTILLNTLAQPALSRNTIVLMNMITFVFYLGTAGVICLIYALKNARVRKARIEAAMLDTEIYDMFKHVIDLPYAISDENGNVKIINGALQDILGYRRAVTGISFSAICSVPIKTVTDAVRNREKHFDSDEYALPTDMNISKSMVTRLADGRRYEIISYSFKMRGEEYYFIVFRDVNEFLELVEHTERENTVVAYIALDNLQELIQYVRADYRTASTEAENILKAWVDGMNGFIREYENDKYIAIFSRKELDKQMQNEFDIQRQIMALTVGDNSFPVTISIGISYVGETLKEKEKIASDALAIAVRRGGNQVAVRREDLTGYMFFGGTHKVIEDNTAIVSRVSGELLESKIRSSSGVLIMGHSNPDFDSVGSCVGLARFAISVLEDEYKKRPDEKRPAVNVVIDKNAESFETCLAQLAPMKTYDSIFITKEAARDLVDTNTVLIISDVNNPFIYESPDLANAVRDIAVIDHHRLAGALPFEPFLQYIETTKSSASEMVSEMLMRSRFGDLLHKEEAEVLLSGIMLDTNNYTRNAGAQTFEMTHYLYSRGAHTGVVREFFNESLDDVLLEGEFESKARIYRDCVAITWLNLEREANANDRIIAARVADNLLSIKGVKASFALIRIGNDVSISGRSKGEINVQLILERLKGGGHFDLAGAQLRNTVLSTACEMLKDAIDNYFEYDHKRPTKK